MPSSSLFSRLLSWNGSLSLNSDDSIPHLCPPFVSGSFTLSVCMVFPDIGSCFPTSNPSAMSHHSGNKANEGGKLCFHSSMRGGMEIILLKSFHSMRRIFDETYGCIFCLNINLSIKLIFQVQWNLLTRWLRWCLF